MTDRHQLLFLALVTPLLSVLGGCEVRQAQTALQTALTASAEATSTLDEDIAQRIEAATDEATVRSFEPTVRGLEATVLVLTHAQELLTAWIETGDYPDFEAICEEVSGALVELLVVLEPLELPDLSVRIDPASYTRACDLIAHLLDDQ